MPGCNCCGGATGGCPAEYVTVTLTDLPNENRVTTSASSDYDGDNYMASNEGEYTLYLWYEREVFIQGNGGVRHECFYRYSDAIETGVEPALSILVTIYNYYNATTPFWEVYVDVDADGGQLLWVKTTTALSLPVSFSNSDVTINGSAELVTNTYYTVPVPWTLQPTMSATVSAVTAGSKAQCVTEPCDFVGIGGYDPLDMCNRIMTVTNSTNRPAYCGENPSVLRILAPGSSNMNYVEFVNAGTDTLDLTLPDWTGSISYYGTTVTAAFGGTTHSLGWGGYNNLLLNARPSTTNSTALCGGTSGYYTIKGNGWVGARTVLLTLDDSATGGPVTNIWCIALTNAELLKRYEADSYGTVVATPSRRIRLNVGLYYHDGIEPNGTWLTVQTDSTVNFISDGTVNEDAYTYGSFPTFTDTNVAATVNRCPIANFTNERITWSSRQFTLAQG
jgi:FlaG/FlaF family flagellin (archaellin)